MKFIFAHGFAMDSTFWKPLRPFFEDHACEFLESSHSLNFCSNEPLIGIGHSYGLHRLLQLGIKWDRLIGIKSFVNFLGNSQILNKKRFQEFQAFKQQLITHPTKTLTEFYKKCDFIPEALPPHSYLLRELEALKDPIDLPHLPTLIIGGEGDTVVPPEIIRDNFIKKNHVKLKFTPCKNHGISHHPELIADYIYDFINGEF